MFDWSVSRQQASSFAEEIAASSHLPAVELSELCNSFDGIMARQDFTKKYSWSIPCREVIEEIFWLKQPVIDLMSGSGWWTKLLRDRGCTVIPIDNNTTHKFNKTWVKARKPQSLLDVRLAPVVFLSWPPYQHYGAALYISKMVSGQALVYIGEHGGGCCAEDTFFEILDENFEKIRDIPLPQWYGMHDYCTVYRRK